MSTQPPPGPPEGAAAQNGPPMLSTITSLPPLPNPLHPRGSANTAAESMRVLRTLGENASSGAVGESSVVHLIPCLVLHGPLLPATVSSPPEGSPSFTLPFLKLANRRLPLPHEHGLPPTPSPAYPNPNRHRPPSAR